jgi:hypothetical protein
MKGFFVILITATAIGWISAQARRKSALRLGEIWLFPPVWAMKMVYIAVLLLGFGLMVLGYSGPQNDRVLVTSGGLLFAILAALTWPKAVEVSESKLQQRSWCGMWKEIFWAEMSSYKQKKDGSIIVSSRRNRISFTPYHVDRKLFLEQIKKHSFKHPYQENGTNNEDSPK